MVDPEEQAVRNVAAGFVATWDAHDMKAFARLFAEDADFVNVLGQWMRGRPEIRAVHEQVHATRFRRAVLEDLDTSVRFLREEVALAHVRWRLSGARDVTGHAERPREGVLTLVLTRQDGRWLIAAAQNTDRHRTGETPRPS